MESNANDKVIRLEGPDWKAVINCSILFPCSMSKLQQFYKKFIIPAVNTEAETVISELIEYLHERMESIAKETMWFQEAYVRQNTKRKELIDHRASGKHANGVPMSMQEIHQAGIDIKKMNQACSHLANDINKKVREAKKLKANWDYLCGLVVLQK